MAAMGLDAKPLQVAHAYQMVSAELEARILDGRLRPGEQLPGEVEMASLFGVNRSTIREGIRKLETEGLVRRASPRKLVVSIPRSRDLATRSSRALRLLEVTFDELWTTAIATEPLAAELAARNADAEDIARLDANHARLTAATASAEAGAPDARGEIVALDTQFHSLVAAAGKNRALMLAREPVGFLLYSGMEALVPRLPQAPGRQVDAHAGMIEAIRAGDPARAGDWMRKHIRDFRRGYEMAGLPMDVPIAPLVPGGARPGAEPKA
ncbi:transcriptional regulator, GntR family [Albimonas donghaensis]|uniref:Transcriptional regulator, GntR family n=2 Tax=Albimonas donghaensis TaxID=356660 RepID=A0A1H3AEQ6_9RHOB|nr:transcriptional regulator, GntR family [Albimonas donghaensis]